MSDYKNSIKRKFIMYFAVFQDLPNVTQFYNDRIVLVTGGTGFLGRVLIEKLLRDLNIKKIYLLVRPKDKRSAKERISKMFEETVSI